MNSLNARGGKSMTAADNAAGRTTAASLPCCLTSRRIKCVEEALVYVGFAARISVSRVAATGRQCPFAVVSSGRSTGLWHRQASSGCFRDFDPANGRRPMSAVPRKPVGGDAIFRPPVRPVVAGTASTRTVPTADTGRTRLRVEGQVPGPISCSRRRPASSGRSRAAAFVQVTPSGQWPRSAATTGRHMTARNSSRSLPQLPN